MSHPEPDVQMPAQAADAEYARLHQLQGRLRLVSESLERLPQFAATVQQLGTVTERRAAMLADARAARDMLDTILGLEPNLDPRALVSAQDRALGAVTDHLLTLVRNVHSVRTAMREACNWDGELQVPDPAADRGASDDDAQPEQSPSPTS